MPGKKFWRLNTWQENTNPGEKVRRLIGEKPLITWPKAKNYVGEDAPRSAENKAPIGPSSQ